MRFLIFHNTSNPVVIAKKRLKDASNDLMLAEFSLLRGLDHPNILRIFELYSDDKNYYLVTE